MNPRQRTAIHVSIWCAAGIVGAIAVLYARLIGWAQGAYFQYFERHPWLCTVITPFLFVAAAGLVQLFSIEARGSGIPQVLEAIEIAHEPGGTRAIWAHRLVSLRTAFFKVLSSCVGTLAGASIGREGPTVQIAASGFAWIGGKISKFYPGADFTTFLTAGAATGVAAAFNTPLAGITFALEEIAEGAFGPFKQIVILSVLIGGITAQALAGNYLYFGHPVLQESILLESVLQAVPIGLMVGLFGGLFARLLAMPFPVALPERWWLRALVLGTLCSLIGFFTEAKTAGSGYEATRAALESLAAESRPALLFPISKFVTTVLSYLSGMAGGIFSPCLSIGAGFGFTLGTLLHFTNLKTCALVGMVAFFSGVVQAPLTAVVIVMEMTDQHTIILPLMTAAFLAQGTSRILMPTPLYRYLAMRNRKG